MKRKTILVILFAFFMLFIPRVVLCESEDNLYSIINWKDKDIAEKENELNHNKESNGLLLPSNLELIGEEAFEGTGFTNISIPESVEKIEGRAFAGIKQLFTVKISAEIIIINDSAFDGNNNLVLSGFAGSAVKSWAESRGFRFILLEQFRRMDETGYFAFVPERKDYKKQLYLNYSELCDSEQIRVKQSTGRSCGELKASNYTGTASVYVQSRYFP